MAISERSIRQQSKDQLWGAFLTAGLLALGFRRERDTFTAKSRHNSRARVTADREADRGRLAKTPSDIPARGWKDILIRVYHNIGQDRVISIAAGVTFYSVLALFPAIAALVSVYGLFADPTTIAKDVNALSAVMPGGAISVVGDEISRIASQGNNKLGVTFVVGLLMALWSANAGIKSMFDALNLVYNEEEKRGLIKLNAVSLAFTAAVIGFVLVALGAMVALPLIMQELGIATITETLVKWLRWPALFLVVAFGLAVLYRFGPSRRKPQWRWITWGSVAAAVCWLVASLLFTWYAANFGSYNATYGSLGAVIGFMVWIWISVIVVLLGAELDAEMEHQTVRDTTVEDGKPLGARGAHMADTVGARQ